MDELRVRDPDEVPEPPTPRSRLRGLLRDVLAPILVVALGFWALGQYRAPDLPEVAPGFSLTSLAGGRVALEDLRGRPVVLNFWATWCGPCQLEMPLLRSYAEDHPEVTVLFVAVDGTPEQLTAYAVDRGLALDRVLRIDDPTRAAYAVSTLPTTVVVGPDGRVGATHAGVLMPGQLSLMVGG